MGVWREDYTIQFFSRRNALLFLMAFCLVVGFGTGNRAAVFAGEFLFILLLLQWFTSSGIAAEFKVKRVHTPRAFENDTVPVDLELSNLSFRDAYLVEVSDSFPPAGEYHVASMVSEVPRQSMVPIRYQQKCSRRRGLYLLGPVNIRMRDPLGIYVYHRTVDELSRMLVYPQTVGIPGFGVLGSGTHFEIGEEIARRIGRSEEFAGIRRYRQGDPPRLIHWRSTAKMGAPYVKEFDQSVVTEVTIYCDLFLLALAGVGDLTSVEFRVKAAASIAEEAIRRHHLVKVVAVKNPLDQTSMAGGTQHLIATLDWMALLKAEGHGSFEEVVLEDAESLRRGSTCILVLSTVHLVPERLFEAVALLKLRNIKVITVLVDDRSFLKLRREQEELFRHAPKLEALEAALRNQGCIVYSLVNQQDLAEQLGVPA